MGRRGRGDVMLVMLVGLLTIPKTEGENLARFLNPVIQSDLFIP